MITKFQEVYPGLYRGSAPSPSDIKVLKEKYNINKIVSLDGPSADKIKNTCKALQIQHVILPIGQNYRTDIANILKYGLKKLLLEDGPVFVHCAAGKDRTGFIIGLFQCIFLKENCETVIEEAKKLGFGKVDPEYMPVIKLMEKLIRSTSKDVNYTIVDNVREPFGDLRDSYLQHAGRTSFAPYLNPTRTYPRDIVYNPVNDQIDTRENFKAIKPYKDVATNKIPLVGIYNNDAVSHGFGPSEISGRFSE